MPRFKRKPAPDALYRPGDLILFKREATRGGGTSYTNYKVVFIIDVYKIKSIRYQVIEIENWSGERDRWTNPSVKNVTEAKLLHWFRVIDEEKWEESPHDLRFLAVHGSPVSLIQDLFENDSFKRQRMKMLELAQRRVVKLEEEVKGIERAKELLEVRYEGNDSRST